MDNRDKVATLVSEAFYVYANLRSKQGTAKHHREISLRDEREVARLERRRDEITKKLKALGYHDVGHAKGELKKEDINGASESRKAD